MTGSFAAAKSYLGRRAEARRARLRARA